MKNRKSFTVQEIKEKMARYCAYQDRCHQEVEQKLYEFQLIPEARDLIIIELIKHDFLNEERFARSYVRGKFYQKKWGKIKITQELKKRNIPAKLIEKAMSEIDEQDYLSTLEKLIQKKIATLNDSKAYIKSQKAIRYALQKGYAYADILSVMQTD